MSSKEQYKDYVKRHKAVVKELKEKLEDEQTANGRLNQLLILERQKAYNYCEKLQKADVKAFNYFLLGIMVAIGAFILGTIIT